MEPDTFVFGNEVGQQVRSIRVAWEKTRTAAGLTGMSGREFDEQGIARPFVALVHFCEQRGSILATPNPRSSDELNARLRREFRLS